MPTIRPFASACLALGLSVFMTAASGAAMLNETKHDAATLPAATETSIAFADLGLGPMALQGVESSAHVNIGTRQDEVVVGGKVRLRFTYSPAMLPDLSHLRVSLNGQVVAAIALPKTEAGREIERDIQLDARYFSDYNEIRFDLIGHYSTECEDPQYSSLWATISPSSELTLVTRRIELRNDLALLPAPFFDRHDNRPLSLPVLIAAHPSLETLRSAGIAASWFGVLADYRGARFPLRMDTLPAEHALVFATNQSRPALLDLPTVDVPTVRILDNPSNPLLKLLVFQGRDEAQLRQAVVGFVLGGPVLTGSSATFDAVDQPRRAAYDAPRWLRTDRAIKLGDLVDSPQQLGSVGIAPPPINVHLRIPPDLFTWNRAGVPIDLHYRYTAPIAADNSSLTVSVNDQLLRSFRLSPDSSGDGHFVVPLLENDSSRQTRGLLIPAFQISGDNQLQFKFALEYHRQGLCKEVFTDNSREAIDPDSTIDLSGFPHYTAMPNLALFANAGYPFTRYADLGETAIVMPDASDPAAIEQLFFLLGRMGRQTGAAALAYQLLDIGQARQARNLDLLLLSGAQSNALAASWGNDLGLLLGASDRRFHPHGAAGVTVRAGGSLGAFLSFESPLTAGRTVVALLGTDAAAAAALTTALAKDAAVASIRGDLTVVRGNDLTSYSKQGVYYVGSLSSWQWLWFHFSQHALLLTIVSIATAILAALLIYGWLQRLAARRLAPRSSG